MDIFVQSQNMALYRKKLADPKTSDAERKMVEKLMAEEKAKQAAFSEQAKD
jgi:hypothetical protein